jgi:hypothetical protein
MSRDEREFQKLIGDSPKKKKHKAKKRRESSRGRERAKKKKEKGKKDEKVTKTPKGPKKGPGPTDRMDIYREREKNLRAAFVNTLTNSQLGKVEFSENYDKISVRFFGEKFSYRIVVKREVNVGSWNRREGEIYIDKDMFEPKDMDSFKALCVHEAIEKFLVERFGLKVDEESHLVATAKEQQYLERIGGNWRSHQLKVYHLWDKLDRH